MFTYIPLTYSNPISILGENDVFHQKDCEYTHGTKIIYTLNSKTEYTIGQNMYTPENKKVYFPIEGERPYSGYSYIGIIKSYNKPNNRTLEIDLGTVGPNSGAYDTQKFIHEKINDAVPNGWDSQIKNEPILNVYYRDLYSLYNNKYVDFQPYYEITLGNLMDYTAIGSYILFGYNVNNNNNNQISTKNVENFAWYGFIGGKNKIVFYNHLLEGSAFQDEYYKVDRQSNVVEGEIGTTIKLYRFNLTFSQIWKSKEYDTQYETWKIFNSFKLTWNF